MSDETREAERIVPTKIRVIGLQEAHLPDLARIETLCAELYHEIGLTQIVPRNDVQIATLFRSHDLVVAEADHEVAGYLAWRDMAPKVAALDVLVVDPELQRFGIATRLLRELGERAQGFSIRQVVTASWRAATWAERFLAALGFQELGSTADVPAPVRQWHEEHQGELLDGQYHLWRPTEKLGLKIIPGLPLPT